MTSLSKAELVVTTCRVVCEICSTFKWLSCGNVATRWSQCLTKLFTWCEAGLMSLQKKWHFAALAGCRSIELQSSASVRPGLGKRDPTVKLVCANQIWIEICLLASAVCHLKCCQTLSWNLRKFVKKLQIGSRTTLTCVCRCSDWGALVCYCS